MALQVSKDIQNLANAAEERRKQEEQGIGIAEAGLGLGGAAFAAQTGRTPAPTPPPKLSTFAQQVADADAARLASGRGPANPVAPMSQYTYNQPIGPQKPVPPMSQYTYNQPIGPSQYRGGYFDNPNVGRTVSSTQGNVPFGPQTLDEANAVNRANLLARTQNTARNLVTSIGSGAQKTLLSGRGGVMLEPLLLGAGDLFGVNEQDPDILARAAAEQQAQRTAQEDYVRGMENLQTMASLQQPTAMTDALPDMSEATQEARGERLVTRDGVTTFDGAEFFRDVTPEEAARIEATNAQFQAQAPEPRKDPVQIKVGDDMVGADELIGGFMRGLDPTSGYGTAGGSALDQAAAMAPTETPVATGAAPAAPEVSTAQQNFLARQQQGTPLTAQEINAAKRYATSQGQIFDPETGYAPAEFYGQQYVGQSIGDYLRAVDEPTQKAEQARSVFERASAEREAKIEARPNFMKARPSQARQDGVMSMAQARKLTGGDRDAAKRMIELQKMGRDPLTGQPMGMTEYQTETLRQNQERIDFAKEQAETARQVALAKGATQAQKDAFELKQKELNYAMTYQDFLKDQEGPAFNAKDIEADLEGIEDQLDFVYDPEAGVFRKGKLGFGEGPVLDINDPKNASIVRTIGTYKVGKALLDKYPKKG